MSSDAVYTTKDGDVLDAVVHSFYGKTDGTLEVVLDANRHLSGFQSLLPPGIEIVLPDIQEKERPAPVRLFD